MRRIVFAERTFTMPEQSEPHPLREVLETLLAGDRFSLVSLIAKGPRTELDEAYLRRSIESDIIDEYEVEPPIRLLTTFVSCQQGDSAITDFVLG